MKNCGIDRELRSSFSTLDPSVLLTPQDVASVIAAPSVSSVYTALYRRELPEPVIRANRRIRWTVRQIRDYINGLESALMDRQDAEFMSTGKQTIASKRGRPRTSRNSI